MHHKDDQEDLVINHFHILLQQSLDKDLHIHGPALKTLEERQADM